MHASSEGQNLEIVHLTEDTPRFTKHIQGVSGSETDTPITIRTIYDVTLGATRTSR